MMQCTGQYLEEFKLGHVVEVDGSLVGGFIHDLILKMCRNGPVAQQHNGSGFHHLENRGPCDASQQIVCLRFLKPVLS